MTELIKVGGIRIEMTIVDVDDSAPWFLSGVISARCLRSDGCVFVHFGFHPENISYKMDMVAIGNNRSDSICGNGQQHFSTWNVVGQEFYIYDEDDFCFNAVRFERWRERNLCSKDKALLKRLISGFCNRAALEAGFNNR